MTIEALVHVRAREIARLEALGQIDPKCLTCQHELYPFYREQWTPGASDPFVPPHQASERCRSGKHPHCSCSACF